ncbi:hypothetical protein MVEN_00953900 [Mycena venus]|uniref:F-box domain-containing protein n=1 Tax=Mycena venus TaxID=2733690 RepID=A0A8H6YDV6_9AGAR|nr:hypothetical protein MVEN_00953900 [Mycena venus]
MTRLPYPYPYINVTNAEHIDTKRRSGTVFAVIIGIDNYFKNDELSPIRGAINDARAFQRYILDDLGVPPSNIVTLEDETATRVNILSTIQSHLRDNPNIPDHRDAMPGRNDNEEVTMFLFFAGHGTRIDALEGVIAPDAQIEAICPVDERTTDAVGHYVHAIPDYVLRRLLWDIAAEKGPNITVILDCCHSGGMDRDVGKARTAASDSSSIPLDLDSRLWKDEKDTIPYLMWSKSSTPYVVLAACRADETARELKYQDGHRGRFTITLISLLRSGPIDSITYTELMSQIPKWPGQSPHCRGARINRPVFGSRGRYPTTGRRSVLLTPQKLGTLPGTSSHLSSGLFRVDMGTVDGVLSGTEFVVYDANSTGVVLCTLVAQSVQADHAILARKAHEHPVTIPRWSRAVVSDWNSPPILVYVPDDFPHAADLFRKTHTTRSPKFVRVGSLQDAHIVVRSNGDEIVVEQCTRMKLRVPPETRFTLRGNLAHLPEVIDGISHFDYFFGCDHNQRDGLEGVSLEMHRLQGVYPARHPDLNGNVVKNSEVQLPSDAGAVYGFTIRNDSCYGVFPHLFYFDLKTKTIQSWYSPAASLPSGGMVSLGMGSDPAFDFTLLPGELSSPGFLKLFVMTEYIDLRRIQQELSPFDPHFVGTGRLRMPDESLDLTGTRWGALTVPVRIAGLCSPAPDSPATAVTVDVRPPRSPTSSRVRSAFSTSSYTYALQDVSPPLSYILPLRLLYLMNLFLVLCNGLEAKPALRAGAAHFIAANYHQLNICVKAMPSSSRPCPHYLALSDTIDASKSPQIPPAVVESNRPPTDLEVLCIQRVINEVRARKTRLDARIAALQSALNQLIADRDALEEEIRMRQGTLSPLRRMPTELLSLIFGFLSRFKLRERQNPAPWTVSQVCYRWREIVSSQPSFWTRIDLDLGNLNNRSLKTPTQTSFGLVTQLRWSGKEPLDVVFTSYRPYVYTDKECALLKILAGHSARWEKLRISGSPAALSSSLAPIRCRLPLLRTLNVSSTPLRNEPWQLRTLDVFEIAPNLRHASVNKGGWGDPMHVILPFPGLVQYAAYSSWDGHLSVLRSMSFLVECALNIKDISTPPATTIPLPHLLRLSLSKPDFLECLDTPNLQDLYCSSRSDHLSSPFSRRPYRLQKLVLSFPRLDRRCHEHPSSCSNCHRFRAGDSSGIHGWSLQCPHPAERAK